jgi:hypothetical protein
LLHYALLWAALAAAPADAAARPRALDVAAVELAARATAEEEPGKLALAVAAPGEELRPAVEAALADALARRGFSVLALRGAELADPHAAARDRGADALLRVRVTPGPTQLALAAELSRTRPNFFLQGDAPRPVPRLAATTIPLDPALRGLIAPPRLDALALVPLGELPERVLALAAGPVAQGAVRLVAVTPTGVALLAPGGALLAVRPLPAPPPGPRVRDLAAVAAVGDFGGGRIAYAVAGRPEGEILAGEGDHLEPVASIPAAPLAAGGAGALFGAFEPGRGTLQDLLSPLVDPEARPRSGRALFAVAAAPRPGRVAFAALETDFSLRLLGADLEPAGRAVPGVGVGFALADLDGDGEPELVASRPSPGPSDQLRVVRPGAPERVLFTTPELMGSVVAAAAADVTGDGIDDVVVAAAQPAGGTRLWLLTADAQGVAR